MIPSGGATFPFPTKTGGGSMELRDFFAVAALQGMLATDMAQQAIDLGVSHEANERAMAVQAYAYADAMLQEREQRR